MPSNKALSVWAGRSETRSTHLRALTSRPLGGALYPCIKPALEGAWSIFQGTMSQVSLDIAWQNGFFFFQDKAGQDTVLFLFS